MPGVSDNVGWLPSVFGVPDIPLDTTKPAAFDASMYTMVGVLVLMSNGDVTGPMGDDPSADNE